MASPGQGQFPLNGLLQHLDAWWSGSGPLYRRLANALRPAISHGDLSTGDLLPPERVLARQLKISRSTVVAAYAMLTDEGVLERRRAAAHACARRRCAAASDCPTRPIATSCSAALSTGPADRKSTRLNSSHIPL